MKSLKDMLNEALVVEAEEFGDDTRVTMRTIDELEDYLKANIANYDEYAKNGNINIDGTGITFMKNRKVDIKFATKPTFAEVAGQLAELIAHWNEMKSAPVKKLRAAKEPLHDPRRGGAIDSEKRAERLKKWKEDPELQKYAR